MKRKIVYVLLVLVVATAVAIFSNGCTSQEKADPTGGAGQEETLLEDTLKEETLQEETTPRDGSVSGTSTEEAISNEGSDPVREVTAPATAGEKTVTITINCASIYDNLENFDSSKRGLLPGDGLITPTTRVEIQEGETVFDVLLKVTKDQKIHMEYVSTPLYKSNYIEGIGNIYEIDAGPLSGWMYKVNDSFPGYGCGRYVLEDGDRIEWVYTCDLGRDIGGDWNEQNK